MAEPGGQRQREVDAAPGGCGRSGEGAGPAAVIGVIVQAGFTTGSAGAGPAAVAGVAGLVVIGVAGLMLDTDRPERAEVAYTAVRRDWRGKAVASTLKRTSMAWAAEHGISEVYTWTQQGNANIGITMAPFTQPVGQPPPDDDT